MAVNRFIRPAPFVQPTPNPSQFVERAFVPEGVAKGYTELPYDSILKPITDMQQRADQYYENEAKLRVKMADLQGLRQLETVEGLTDVSHLGDKLIAAKLEAYNKHMRDNVTTYNNNPTDRRAGRGLMDIAANIEGDRELRQLIADRSTGAANDARVRAAGNNTPETRYRNYPVFEAHANFQQGSPLVEAHPLKAINRTEMLDKALSGMPASAYQSAGLNVSRVGGMPTRITSQSGDEGVTAQRVNGVLDAAINQNPELLSDVQTNARYDYVMHRRENPDSTESYQDFYKKHVDALKQYALNKYVYNKHTENVSAAQITQPKGTAGKKRPTTGTVMRGASSLDAFNAMPGLYDARGVSNLTHPDTGADGQQLVQLTALNTMRNEVDANGHQTDDARYASNLYTTARDLTITPAHIKIYANLHHISEDEARNDLYGAIGSDSSFATDVLGSAFGNRAGGFLRSTGLVDKFRENATKLHQSSIQPTSYTPSTMDSDDGYYQASRATAGYINANRSGISSIDVDGEDAPLDREKYKNVIFNNSEPTSFAYNPFNNSVTISGVAKVGDDERNTTVRYNGQQSAAGVVDAHVNALANNGEVDSAFNIRAGSKLNDSSEGREVIKNISRLVPKPASAVQNGEFDTITIPGTNQAVQVRAVVSDDLTTVVYQVPDNSVAGGVVSTDLNTLLGGVYQTMNPYDYQTFYGRYAPQGDENLPEDQTNQ